MDEWLNAWGGWTADVRDDPYELFEQLRSACPVHPVRLADGHDARLVIGHDAARLALKDGRLSKDMLAAMDADPAIVDEGLPGPAFARHMLAVDPPRTTPGSVVSSPPRSSPRAWPRSNRRSRASPTTCSTRSKPRDLASWSTSWPDMRSRCRSA